MSANEIKSTVEGNGNVWTTTMDTLRDAFGAGRLGVNVCTQIAASLAGIGLGHVPRELPSYQHQPVRLYKRGTPVGDLIEKVLMPGQQNDEAIAELAGEQATDYGAIVQKIRELVGE